MSTSARRASFCRFCATFCASFDTRTIVGAVKRADASQRPHLKSSGKSSSIMCPRTEVTVISTDTCAGPRAEPPTTARGRRYGKSKFRQYLSRPSRCVRKNRPTFEKEPLDNIWAMVLAMDAALTWRRTLLGHAQDAHRERRAVLVLAKLCPRPDVEGSVVK